MPAITTDPAVGLALWMQLHDSAFPAGRMVHSQGFEGWLAERPDAGADEIATAVIEYLTDSHAPLDATITAAAWRAHATPRELCELDCLLGSYKLFGNARTASESAGRQLVFTAQHIGLGCGCRYLDAVASGVTPGNCAVVDGALQAHLGIPLHTAVLGSMRSMVASVLSAAVRLGRLGPMQSQRIQAHGVSRIAQLTHEACQRSVHDLHSTAPALEISGMLHETRTSRLFAT
jgi:urease accessory protein